MADLRHGVGVISSPRVTRPRRKEQHHGSMSPRSSSRNPRFRWQDPKDISSTDRGSIHKTDPEPDVAPSSASRIEDHGTPIPSTRVRRPIRSAKAFYREPTSSPRTAPGPDDRQER